MIDHSSRLGLTKRYLATRNNESDFPITSLLLCQLDNTIT
jgi:hypothetical protein